MSRVRVSPFSMSMDGYVAGSGQSLDHPLGVGGEQLRRWAFATATFRLAHRMEGGATGPDDDVVIEGGGGKAPRELPGLVDGFTVAEVANSPAVAHFQLTPR